MGLNKLIYISGGCRSGKSAYAQTLAESLPGKRAYIATCPRIDVEMDQRIATHQQQRLNRGWETLEVPIDLAKAIAQAAEFDVILIDCLTLWINNILYTAEQSGIKISEQTISARCADLITTCRNNKQTIIFVSNELGMGLVPADAVSRHYRDCLGRCNQAIAKHVDEAVFMVSGLPIFLKTRTNLANP